MGVGFAKPHKLVTPFSTNKLHETTVYSPDAISKDADKKKSVQKSAKDLFQAWGLYRMLMTKIMMIIKC